MRREAAESSRASASQRSIAASIRERRPEVALAILEILDPPEVVEPLELGEPAPGEERGAVGVPLRRLEIERGALDLAVLERERDEAGRERAGHEEHERRGGRGAAAPEREPAQPAPGLHRDGIPAADAREIVGERRRRRVPAVRIGIERRPEDGVEIGGDAGVETPRRRARPECARQVSRRRFDRRVEPPPARQRLVQGGGETVDVGPAIDAALFRRRTAPAP